MNFPKEVKCVTKRPHDSFLYVLVCFLCGKETDQTGGPNFLSIFESIVASNAPALTTGSKSGFHQIHQRPRASLVARDFALFIEYRRHYPDTLVKMGCFGKTLPTAVSLLRKGLTSSIGCRLVSS